jgi:squalene-hopene/tetraprenyl-beta-curcumene cyclase
MRRRTFGWSAIALAMLLSAPSLQAEDAKSYEEMVAKGITFLEKNQARDGSYSAQAGPGITALITTALLRHGRSPDDPVVAKSLKYLESFVQDDGGIYKPDSRLKNYETCLAVVCFKEANANGRYDKILKQADKYIKGEQWDEDKGKTKADFDYGGAGYGGKSRPDLSNTQFFMEALQATGNDADSEAIQKALVFVSRCQNLESEHNTAPPAAKVEDGGFYYTVSSGGASPAGKTDEGGLRSYGSMTYAGLKSMIFAGVKPDDPRVKAAVKWVQKNYDLKQNPGMGDAGLYYYYHTFAKALDAIGQDEFTDADGTKHNWRKELIAELASRQRPNGSWVNENQKWLEGDANMVTGFALLTLSYCK